MFNARISGLIGPCILALSLFSTSALAHSYTLGTLQIGHPWSRPNPPGAPTAVGWAFNPVWRDVGPTRAKNFVSRSTHIEAPAVSDQGGRTIWKCPTVAKPDLSEQAGSIVDKDGVITEIAINVSNTIVARALEPNPDLVLYLIGSIQYNDIFPDTSAHHFDWCVAAVPSNLVTGGFNLHRMYEREYEK